MVGLSSSYGAGWHFKIIFGKSLECLGNVQENNGKGRRKYIRGIVGVLYDRYFRLCLANYPKLGVKKAQTRIKA